MTEDLGKYCRLGYLGLLLSIVNAIETTILRKVLIRPHNIAYITFVLCKLPVF